MVLTKHTIIGIIITIAFIIVALILGLIPVYMKYNRQTIITSTTNQLSTTKTMLSTFIDHSEEIITSTTRKITATSTTPPKQTITVITTSSTRINTMTTSSTTTTTTKSTIGTDMSTTTTTTAVDAIDTMTTIESTTTTTGNSNTTKINLNTETDTMNDVTITVNPNSVVSITTDLVTSTMPVGITKTRTLKQSEASTSDLAVTKFSAQITSNTDNVPSLTKSVSVLTTSDVTYQSTIEPSSIASRSTSDSP